MKEPEADADEALQSLRTVMWFQDHCWWICTIRPEPPAAPSFSWLAKGSRLRPGSVTDVCNMADVHWSFPAKSISAANRWVRCEPTLQHSLRADGQLLASRDAIIAALELDIRTKDDRIAALELAASAPEVWKDYTASSSSGYGGGSSSGSWTQYPQDAPKRAGGWMNKMVAMLAAIYQRDETKIQHLAEV
jgi:hypothetical protein